MSADSPTSDPQSAAIGAYVDAVYQDALHRDAEPAAQSWWAAFLDSGQPRIAFTTQIARSDEHLTDLIDAAYQTCLDRAPDAAGLQYWLAETRAGLSEEVLQATLLASDEFYARAGGTTAAWTDALYQTALGRPADPAAASWVDSSLQAGESRGRIALAIAMSFESEARFVRQQFAQTQTPWSPAATSLWAPQLADGRATQEELTADLLAAAQFFKLHTGVPITVVPVPNIEPGALEDFAHINSLASRGGGNVLFLGDSITREWLGQGGTPAWNQYFAPLGSLDAGVAGDTTENILWRLQQGNLKGISPKLAVVMVGLNDLTEDANPADVEAGIAAVVRTLRAELPETKVLLLGILPGLQTAADAAFRQEIVQVNQSLPPLADEQYVWFLDLGGYFINPDGSINSSLYLFDHTHPNAEGYRVMAQALAPWVEALIA